MNAVDASVAVAALAILGYALTRDTSWITVSASSFVVGSSFLRQCQDNPFLLKAGGLALALGGAALAAFGLEGLGHATAHTEAMSLTVSLLAAGTGVYVAGAGLLTYQGGMYETDAYRDNGDNETTTNPWLAGLAHPTRGIGARSCQRLLDGPISWINSHLVNPAIFWAPPQMKLRKPFSTSMWARMPWRLATGSVAMATGTPQGLAFAAANAAWALGDLSIGSLDWQDQGADP